MKWLRRWFGSLPTAPIDDALWLSQRLRIVGAEDLSDAHAHRWRTLTAHFLADKNITAAADCDLRDVDRMLIAMLCCKPVLDLGYHWLRGWKEVVVYPGAFGMRRQHLDEDSGVLHEWDDALVGECWERGPLILSLHDAIQAAEAPTCGYDVVVHEIAHKLDGLDGRMDGVPPLPDAAWYAEWVADFQAAFDALREDVDRGRETVIDPYAAEAPDEFFAVTSEYHFTDPQHLAVHMPAIATHLARFYHPDRRAA